MERRILEEDWRKLGALRRKALMRFCDELLEQIHAKSDPASTTDSHEAYPDVCRLIDRRNRLLGRLFNTWSRSEAYILLSSWAGEGLLTEEELSSLSPETIAVVNVYNQPRCYPPERD